MPHDTLRLHPDNPHYFLFRGKPFVVVTSAEHYGAVMNRAFDYRKYLATLRGEGLNMTRLFTGGCVEYPGAFSIERNTLAPAPGDFLCPWKRSDTPGYANGGNRFDLSAWDEEYLARLSDFIEIASGYDIVVEVCFFCPFYDEGLWAISPWHADNNVNGLGSMPREDVHTLDRSGALLGIQEAMVRKLAAKLNRFDNLYFEICNEPYNRSLPRDWEHHMTDVLVEAEASLPNQHLISHNIASFAVPAVGPHPAVSILNFHSGSPEVIPWNYHFGRLIGDDETGGVPGDTQHRREGWEFIIAGGGLYNNLDYSFAVGHEDGAFQHPDTTPGGGSPALRRQLRLLKDFLYSFDFIKMKPANYVVRRGLQAHQRAQVLAEAGKQYAVYVFGGMQARLHLTLPEGKYLAEWVNTLTGAVDRREQVDTGVSRPIFTSPEYADDIALRIVRADGGPEAGD